jgi:hypothetical protein
VLTEDIAEELRRRWLEACDLPLSEGTRLVALREIVENL